MFWNLKITTHDCHIEFFLFSDNQQVISRNAFSMEDVQKGNVAVKVKAQFASQLCSDSVTFVATVKAKYSSATQRFNVTYEPDLTRIQVSPAYQHFLYNIF